MASGASGLDGTAQGLLDSPATGIKPHLQGLPIDPGALCPFTNCQRYTLKRQDAVMATIALLFRCCLPSDIARRIGAIVVQASKGVLWRWGSTDIRKERCIRASAIVALW